jgi:uroporphyrinogen decarboxylase
MDIRYSPKERVLKALNHEEPDRVPVFITIVPQVAEQLSRFLGIAEYSHADSPLAENRVSFTELLVAMGNDVVGIGPCAPTRSPTRDIGNGMLINEWQIKFRKIGLYAEMVEHPLAHAETVADIEAFAFPEALAEGRFDLARRMVEKYGKEYAICGDAETTILEASWYLVGLEKFLTDLAMEKAYVFALMDRIMHYSLGVARELVRLGADIIWLGDDVGTQTGMLMSPQMWRDHFKERMRYVISELKRDKPELRIAYHCCGSYVRIMPDLIEIGVDIFNALQPRAARMDLKTIKDSFGAQASLFGGIDIQDVVPFGSLEDVEQEVIRVIRAAARGGGYLLSGAHNIQADTSVEKVAKLFEAARQHGKYPIAEDEPRQE